jgi:hypothetical protein
LKRDVNINDAPDYIEWLIDLLGQAWVESALADYRAHPIRAHFRVNVNPLVPGIAAYEDWRESGEDSHALPNDAIEVARHAAHIRALRNAWEVVPVAENTAYLQERLRTKEDVDAVLYEFSVAFHYSCRSCSVRLRCITDRDGYDIAVSCGMVEAEIECKTTMRGAGRKVHHKQFETLASNLWPALKTARRIYLLDLFCSDRLEERELQALSDAISDKLSREQQGTFSVLGGRYRLSVIPVGERARPLTVNEADGLVAPFWSDPRCRPHMFAVLDSDSRGAPGDTISLSLLVCRSARPDNVLRPLMAALSRASKQLSGTCPSLVSIHVPESIDWAAVGAQSALARRLYDEFQRHRRLDVVSGVAFSGLPTAISRRAVLEGGTPAIFWANPCALHQLPDDFKPSRAP